LSYIRFGESHGGLYAWPECDDDCEGEDLKLALWFVEAESSVHLSPDQARDLLKVVTDFLHDVEHGIK